MRNEHNITALREGLPSCCEIAVAAVGSYTAEGKTRILGFMSNARTLVVLGHHVKASLEWVWFPFENERGGSTCAADLHAKVVIENTGRILEAHGHRTLILPYPGACGIAFKQLAAGMHMGAIGESFLYLHREWGPWVHLRILLTDATVLDPRALKTLDVCLHCGECIKVCPGMALATGHHDQAACRRFQQSQRDQLGIRARYQHKCEACARGCAVGEQPLEILVRDRIPE
jgi:epoxyqueuosine reductase